MPHRRHAAWRGAVAHVADVSSSRSFAEAVARTGGCCGVVSWSQRRGSRGTGSDGARELTQVRPLEQRFVGALVSLAHLVDAEIGGPTPAGRLVQRIQSLRTTVMVLQHPRASLNAREYRLPVMGAAAPRIRRTERPSGGVRKMQPIIPTRRVIERRIDGTRGCPEIAWRPARRPRSTRHRGCGRMADGSRALAQETGTLERAVAPTRRPNGRTVTGARAAGFSQSAHDAVSRQEWARRPARRGPGVARSAAVLRQYACHVLVRDYHLGALGMICR
jgi:hypothetical protein